MYKLLTILGVIISMNSYSIELKPSQIKALENQVKKIQLNLDLINKTTSLTDMDAIKLRNREMDKAKKSLDRVVKALNRMPEHSDVMKAKVKAEEVKVLLTQEIAALVMTENQAKSDLQNQQNKLSSMLSSQQTLDDHQLMQTLNETLREALADFPFSPTENWRALVHHNVWTETEQARLDDLSNTLQNADNLISEAEGLLKQYQAAAKTRDGMRVFGPTLQSLTSAKDKFKKRIPILLESLPISIKQTAKEFHDVYLKEINEFNRANKERDRTALLAKGNPYGWYKTLRLRMNAQLVLYKASGLGNLVEMKAVQDNVKIYADEVSETIDNWQKEQ